MPALNDYLYQVENLLHDSNNVFWSQSQLTNYINEARERLVRDTGCLRTIQNTQTPIASSNPYLGTNNNTTPASTWTANTAVTAGQYVFSNIYIYQYQTSGTSGSTAPAYPTGTNIFPPTTSFADGTATLQYVQNAEIIPFASLPDGIQTIDILGINVLGQQSHSYALFALVRLHGSVALLAKLRWSPYLFLCVRSTAVLHCACARPIVLH